jgi:hypothetical protein
MPATARDETRKIHDAIAEGDQPKVAEPAREARDDLRNRLSEAGEDLRPPRERLADEGRAPRTRAQIQAAMDPQEWACRSAEHSWAQLVPGAVKVPEGMRVFAAAGGNVVIEWDCLHDCGRYREELCTRNLEIVERKYGTRPGYKHVVIHRDETMTKAAMREGVYSSNRKLLRQAVRDAKAAAKAEVQE